MSTVVVSRGEPVASNASIFVSASGFFPNRIDQKVSSIGIEVDLAHLRLPHLL